MASPVSTGLRVGGDTVSSTGAGQTLSGRSKRAVNPLMPLVVSILLAGACASPGHIYKLYPGPRRPAEELAIIRFGDSVSSLRIDGMRVEESDYERVELLPGSYVIDSRKTFSVSPLVNPAGQDEIMGMARVDLVAGHEYTVNAERTTGRGYTMRWWIEDMTTRTVIAGKKWD